MLLLTPPLVLAEDAESPPVSDAAKIQGAWKIESARYDGAKTSELVGVTMTFTDKKVTVKLEGETANDDYVLDPTQKPKHLDTSGKRGEETVKIPAVYQFLDNDTLMICNADPGRPRPTELDTKEGDGRSVVVLKRVKPKGK